jgi:hypothetical protein
MAVVPTIRGKVSMGSIRGTIADVAFVAGDYSSGITLTASSLGLGRIDSVIVLGSTGAGLASFYWDRATSKVRGTGSTATPGLNQETSAAQAAAASPIFILALGDNANKG